MNLKHEIKSIILIKNSDLEELILQEYEIKYSVLIPFFKEFNITKRELTAHEIERLEMFLTKEKKINYMIETLMVDLCNKELIDEGTYVIKL